MLAILRCFWTDRAIWVKSFVTLKLLEPLETLAKRAARSAASGIKLDQCRERSIFVSTTYMFYES